ncbi:MAG: aspartate aminotransferase family protein [Gammaproteobacteria bacterium]
MNDTGGTDETLRDGYFRCFLPVYAPPRPVFVRGAGSRMWDSDGREYVDFGGGVAVLSLGHAAPQVAAALAMQAQKLTHTSNLYANEEAILLARRLTGATFADRVFFCNSGAEANEAALKLARRRGVSRRADKFRVLAFDGGFHGRIGMAMAATGQEKIREGFGPLTPGFCFAPFNDSRAAATKMDDDICAILAEPVQGEGGVRPANPEFLRELRALADAADALLIFDEVQTGAGRCGTLFACDGFGVAPDMMTSAKGLGGGFPIGALLCDEKIADAMPPGAHGSTFGGNPLAARAARAVLDEILSPGFLPGVVARGAEMTARLQKINAELNCFAEIRGRGLLIGCRMADNFSATEVAAAALDDGVAVLTAAGNVLRFAPALNIPPQDIAEGFARLEKTLRQTAA